VTNSIRKGCSIIRDRLDKLRLETDINAMLTEMKATYEQIDILSCLTQDSDDVEAIKDVIDYRNSICLDLIASEKGKVLSKFDKYMARIADLEDMNRELGEEKDDLKDQVADLEDKVSELRDQVDDLKSENEDLNDVIKDFRLDGAVQ
jgi:chromosome segregation ATPase